MRKPFPAVDRVIFALYCIFIAVGLLFMFGVSRYAGAILGYTPFWIFFKQLIFVIGSVAVMFFFMHLPYQKTRLLVKPLVFGTLILMLLVFVPGIGLEAGGARRWLNLRFFSFNPSELAKLTMVIYLSHILVKKQESGSNKLENFTYGLLPPLILAALIFFIILMQSGFSIGIVVLAVVFAMVFIGGASVKHLLGVGLLSLPVLVLAVWRVAYRKQRITAFIDPWQDAGGIGYQGIQSLQAIANGGLFGSGLGNGAQKVARLPAAHTDFIFSVIVEELGFVGGLVLIALFVCFFIQGLKLSLRITDKYAQLLAFGITTLITFHALLNMMIALSLLPPTGVSLPFISYGGSSLLVLSMGVGILLNISSHFTAENPQDHRRY
ncbi:MAG: putative lipid II flippase FtsW [Brevinema sp.]